MFDELGSINAPFVNLIKEKDSLGLRVEGETRPKNENKNRRLQTSIVNAPSIVGRQADKEALVHKLLAGSGGSSRQNFSIVPIVGMGGVGKTTLAKLVYDDEQVKKHFELKAWVCVSDEFDSFAISKEILEVMSKVNKEITSFNLVQEAIRDHIKGKIFLLVLDDVWSDSCDDWETLVGPFHSCAPGSKIIMTTRKEKLLKQLGYSHLIQQLQRLSDEDALCLVARHALGEDNFDSHLSLKPHAEGIVKKCDSLPLALVSLGRLLRMKKHEEDYWKEVLESEIWRLKDDKVLPALRLSYRELSAPLKQLFAYCSLFPKDFQFDKNDLILLWMAEGFLHRSNRSDQTEERVGNEYFEELLSRSFFQYAPNNKSLFVMHDLMNDLATFVSDEFFARLDVEGKKDIQEEMFGKYRHMSFVREQYVAYQKFDGFEKTRSLRTLLATSGGEVYYWQTFYLSNKILVDLLHNLRLLRVLSLSYFKISEIPDSIGTLTHLRYLNLSQTKITYLPENVCNLYNLQMLILLGCDGLVKLPTTFLKLKNLRHLDIRDTKLLNQMPLIIRELNNQNSHSKIIVGAESWREITTLKELMNLCGKVFVVGVDKVPHEWKGNFSKKRFCELVVDSSCLSVGSLNEVVLKELLDGVKPHRENLEQLNIESYDGLVLPVWVGDPSFLLRLKQVSISNCKKCTSLPPLGQLPALKELSISGLDNVEVVGLELLGVGDVAFHSLESLSFSRMNRWKKWLTNSEVVFPCLQNLCIYDCPNLVEVSLETLHSLNGLEISKCDSGVLRRLVQAAPLVCRMEIEHISGLSDVVWRDVIEYLGAVENLRIKCCHEISYLWESKAAVSKVLVMLRKLQVKYCDNLVSLGEKEEEDNCMSNLLTSLRTLEVLNCKNMERCSCPDSIEVLIIWDINSLTTISIPTGGQNLRSLLIMNCNNLLERDWCEQKMNNNNISSMPLLEYLLIRDWPHKKLMVELSSLVHLTQLNISYCERLESFPGSNMTSLMELVIIDCPCMEVCGDWPPNLRSLYIGNLKKPISEWGSQKFPTSLVKLSLRDKEVSSWSQFSHLLPSSLTSLEIKGFEKLESVSMELQHLTSLQHLEFSDCPNINSLPQSLQLTSLKRLSFWNCPSMTDLPEEMLPSLLSLTIWDCPNLEERCSKRGSYWPLIHHIPHMDIQPAHD